jgi:predicted AAA+ superfamily ATPase
MYSRKLGYELEKHLSEKQITVLTGMRRVGKTTLLKIMMDSIESTNKAYFDLERIENRVFFGQQNYRDIENGLKSYGLNFDEKLYLFIDEIQLLPGITSVIKVLYDDYNVKFVVTGSSSFYLRNRFSESLAGRKRVFELFPLTFSEFLNFKGFNENLNIEKEFPPYNIILYNRLKDFYAEYLKFGGFPEVVLSENESNKADLLADIMNSYIEMDVKLLSDYSVSNDLYKLLKLLAARIGSRFEYSKISSIIGISRAKIKEYMDLLSHTYMVHFIDPFTKNIDRAIVSQQKLYLSDTGLARILGCQNTGALIENAVYNQIRHMAPIQYYSDKTGHEIDFIVGGSVALEVKETASISDLNNLRKRAGKINIDEYHLIGNNVLNHEFKDFTWTGSIIIDRVKVF